MGDEKFEKKEYTEAAGDYRRAATVATQRKSASLEEAKAKLEYASARDQAVKNLARLQEKLLKDANDFATAEEIVKIYVVELNDPASANPYLSRIQDPQYKRHAQLAATPVSRLSASDAMSLAVWYRSMGSPTFTAEAQVSLLKRTRSCIKRYLAVQTANDLDVVKARALLLQIEADLAKFRLKPPRDTLAYFSFDKHTMVEKGSDITFKDESGRGGIAKNAGAKPSNEGISGESLNFDGGRVDLTTLNLPAQLKVLTVVAWVRCEKHGLFTVIDNRTWQVTNKGFALRSYSGKPEFVIGAGDWVTAKGNVEIDLNRWVFLAGVIDGDEIRIFVDGREVMQKSFKGPVATGPAISVGNGNYNEAKERPFYGNVDEVYIIGRALLAREIKALFDRYETHDD